ncbi:MAG: hypothetical protein EOP46_12655 [Sphingobacteriaceae bacterium]|nr:MAG: hypothetical protein EOP46_12655 [Sphingobacteriaceae bacterium]
MITVKNNQATVSVDPYGGAIVDFRLCGNDVNPLAFKFTPDQMPANNKPGACYQGHFVCIGRWGAPTSGEIKAGHPNHGQAAMLGWDELERTDSSITMRVDCPLDGLNTVRKLELSEHTAAFRVSEKVKDTAKLGRLYNIVQHPTLSAPFLDSKTRVDSNATFGINYDFDTNPLEYASEWPHGMCKDGELMDLHSPDVANSSVFSFIVDKEADYGWVTAYSPTHNLLLGYVWHRADYPWISVWQHFEDGQIKYRALEFGTTGIHKPVNEILEHDNTFLFGEKTLWFIDAGEEVKRSYTAFLVQPENKFEGVEGVDVREGKISIKPLNGKPIEIQTGFNI